jgi:hypothetical protein
MERATNEALRPYGYAPGKFKKWCAACDTEHRGLAANSFKCRRCAEHQHKEVERLCRSAGYEFGEDEACS